MILTVLFLIVRLNDGTGNEFDTLEREMTPKIEISPSEASQASIQQTGSQMNTRQKAGPDIGPNYGQRRGSLDSDVFHLQEPNRRHLNQARFESATSSVSSVDTLSAEIDTVLTRLNKCLISTNMSSYFKRTGYYGKAQMNARLALEDFRKVIPRLKSSYLAPCWNMSFTARRESLRGKIIKHEKLNRVTIKGYMGDYQFSYGDDLMHRSLHHQIINTIHWGPSGVLKQSIVCLPKVFLLGFPKCGSTFLYCLIRKVLKLALGIAGMCEEAKEPHWWITPGPRQYTQSHSPDYIALYLMNFNKGAKFVENSLPAVTIDASPNLMFQSPRYSESETMENYCLIPSLVPVVLPDSKYFVVMRNPVSMMYSAFWFSCTMEGNNLKSVKFKGPDIFHERVTKKIEIFNDCRSRGEPLDKCVDVVAEDIFSPELPTCGRTRLEMGLYYIHARRWLSVLPRDRIHFFTLEELATQDLRQTGKVILDFLKIPSTDKVLHKFEHIDCNENQQTVVDYKHDPRLKMRDDTRQILENFFQPFNQMLADLLGDDKFLWKN